MIKFKPKEITQYLKEQKKQAESRKNISLVWDFNGPHWTNDDIPSTSGVYAAFVLNRDDTGFPRLL